MPPSCEGRAGWRPVNVVAPIAGEVAKELMRLFVEKAGGVSNARLMLDAEYAATDLAIDALEEARIAKETQP